jgi:ABC-type transporter Mla subunit MlaD
MDADTRLAKLGRLFAAYEESHSHANAFACCSAHTVADVVPGLIAELTEVTIKLETAERQNAELDERIAERTRQLNGLLDSLSFDEKSVPV